MIPRSARLIWSAEKSNVEQTVVKIGQSRLSMQADYLKLVVFYKPLNRSYNLEVNDHILEKMSVRLKKGVRQSWSAEK